ncbi:MAG: hypothetical protein U0165_04085 [Polyangiaceae bacterium]
MRVLDHLGFDSSLIHRWGSNDSSSKDLVDPMTLAQAAIERAGLLISSLVASLVTTWRSPTPALAREADLPALGAAADESLRSASRR